MSEQRYRSRFGMTLQNTVANVISGLLLALVFFFVRENVFPLPDMYGRWHCQTITEETSYADYRGMILGYVAVMLREGDRLAGTVEKVYEKTRSNERYYEGPDRRRGTLSGYVENHHFGPDQLYFHITMAEEQRDITLYFRMSLESKDEAHGRYSATVGDYETGDVTCQRGDFSWTIAPEK